MSNDVEELLELASGANLEASIKKSASLEQKFLNIRAMAVINGFGTMEEMMAAQKKLEEGEGK